MKREGKNRLNIDMERGFGSLAVDVYPPYPPQKGGGEWGSCGGIFVVIEAYIILPINVTVVKGGYCYIKLYKVKCRED